MASEGCGSRWLGNLQSTLLGQVLVALVLVAYRQSCLGISQGLALTYTTEGLLVAAPASAVGPSSHLQYGVENLGVGRLGALFIFKC